MSVTLAPCHMALRAILSCERISVGRIRT